VVRRGVSLFRARNRGKEDVQQTESEIERGRKREQSEGGAAKREREW
jgi:hypothetical protein